MITRGKIKRSVINRSIKRKHRRNFRRRNKDNNLLLIILIILLTFNLAAFVFLVNKGNISKDITIFELVLDTLNIREISAVEHELEQQEHLYDPNSEQVEGYNSVEDEIIIDLEEYENLIVVEDGDSEHGNIPDPINVEKINVDRNKEYILAYHTHTTESFLSDDGKYYNSDTNKNVVSIGNTITTVLKAKGHNIKHDTSVHDLPSMSQSYSRSKNTINKNLGENPNFKFLIDIHRDGREKTSPNLDAFIKAGRIDIGGVSNSTFALVVGPDAPNYVEILSFAKYIKAVSDVMYPGLCRGIIIKPAGKYNLDFSDYSMLLEMGSNWTTIEETHESGKKVGEILSVVFDKLIDE